MLILKLRGFVLLLCASRQINLHCFVNINKNRKAILMYSISVLAREKFASFTKSEILKSFGLNLSAASKDEFYRATCSYKQKHLSVFRNHQGSQSDN